MHELDPNPRDKLVSVAKAIAGACPILGALISEMLNFVPDSRRDRIVSYVKCMEGQIRSMEKRIPIVEKNLKTEKGWDIFEEGMMQAARAVFEERRERLAKLVANSLSEDEIKYEKSKKLLNLYRELTDPEIIWLIYYSLNPTLGEGRHSKWVSKHPEILKPVSREMGRPKEEYEKSALQDSYKASLTRLGLTKKRNNKNNTIVITTLGRMLVSYITDEIEDENS